MTFVKSDSGKLPMRLLPNRAVLKVVEVLQFGAKKNAPNNWRGVDDRNRYYDATLRHLLAWQEGEDTDPESGLPHLAHAACSALFLLEAELRNYGADTRASRTEARVTGKPESGSPEKPKLREPAVTTAVLQETKMMREPGGLLVDRLLEALEKEFSPFNDSAAHKLKVTVVALPVIDVALRYRVLVEVEGGQDAPRWRQDFRLPVSMALTATTNDDIEKGINDFVRQVVTEARADRVEWEAPRLHRRQGRRGGGPMTRRRAFTAPPEHLRCVATRKPLADGTLARCMHRRVPGALRCRAHGGVEPEPSYWVCPATGAIVPHHDLGRHHVVPLRCCGLNDGPQFDRGEWLRDSGWSHTMDCSEHPGVDLTPVFPDPV